jgi:hypothetical protein
MRLKEAGLVVGFISLCVQLCEQQSPSRDFSLYEKPPLIILDPLNSEIRLKAAECRLRRDLWSYWSKRMRAIIRVDARLKDGPAAAMVYFVEPDESGKWSVAIEIEQDRVNMISQQKSHRSDRLRAYAVRRMRNTGHKVASSAAKEDACAYSLSLEDSGGKVVESL